jgi:hypothetical protein
VHNNVLILEQLVIKSSVIELLFPWRNLEEHLQIWVIAETSFIKI